MEKSLSYNPEKVGLTMPVEMQDRLRRFNVEKRGGNTKKRTMGLSRVICEAVEKLLASEGY